MQKQFRVKWCGNDNLVPVFDEYMHGGGLKISLVSADGEAYGVATTNVPGIHLAPDEVILKTYSENEGIDKALQTAGVIGPRIRYENSWPVHKVCLTRLRSQSNVIGVSLSTFLFPTRLSIDLLVLLLCS